MNATAETKTGTSRGAEQQTFMVLGVLLQFLSTPEEINDQIIVMRGTIPSGVVIPLGQQVGLEVPRRSFLPQVFAAAALILPRADLGFFSMAMSPSETMPIALPFEPPSRDDSSQPPIPCPQNRKMSGSSVNAFSTLASWERIARTVLKVSGVRDSLVTIAGAHGHRSCSVEGQLSPLFRYFIGTEPG